MAEETIYFEFKGGGKVGLQLFSSSNERFGLPALVKDDQKETFILLEGCEYEYKILRPGYQFKDSLSKALLYPDHFTDFNGRIRTGNYVGDFILQLEEKATAQTSKKRIQIRSYKINYDTEFRQMLSSIAERCSELVIRINSPVLAKMQPDPGSDVRTIAQRYSYLKSLIDSQTFQNSIQRIFHSPHEKLISENRSVQINSAQKITKKGLKSLAKGRNRVALPNGHPLRSTLESVPTRIQNPRKRPTKDTPENRFIKYILQDFSSFLRQVTKRIKNLGNNSLEFVGEDCVRLTGILDGYLSNPFFREIGEPRIFPLGSPVLQKKAGYRHVFRTWINFYFTGKLFWEGGEDFFETGEKDIATLYEYWLFFELLQLFSEMFNFEKDWEKKVIEADGSGLQLKLKSGKPLTIGGVLERKNRTLNVQFCYNRTYDHSLEYFEPGVWTRRMRPDYSLIIWPSELLLNEAENKELAVHLHFDSKYKVNDITGIIGDDDLDTEKERERKGIYKRADLLKMHAYRDAIKRTIGAFVLYPGTIGKKWPVYHELLPGIGAFAIRPDEGGASTGISALKTFLENTIDYLSNRSSHLESLSFYRQKILRKRDIPEIFFKLPETDSASGERSKPISDQTVLSGFIRNPEHWEWVLKNGLYNLRTSGRGAVEFDSELLKFDYLIFRGPNSALFPGLWERSRPGFRILLKDEIATTGYPVHDKMQDRYIVLDIQPAKIFDGLEWNLPSLENDIGAPYIISLPTVMKSIKA